MSVIVTIRMPGDPKRLEAHAAGNSDAMRAIADHALEHGLIAHRFYGSDDGEILVIDEWPDMESFQGFFEHAQPEIVPLLAAAGVTGEPKVSAWRELETNDEVGWEASV